ncbi:hypothetical protein ACMHYB_50025 [Sorangium sp. So ce1128]
MKISAVVSTLVAASLCAGVALAEGGRAARAPRHIEVHRSRGDMVDRPYRHAPRDQAPERSWRAERAAPNPISRGQERIRCSDTGTDCASRGASAPRSRSEARPAAGRAASAQRSASPLKSKAESRMNCSEAGECTASSTGARGAWAARSVGATREPAAAQGKERAAAPRDLAQRQSPRMSCSEGEECAMSSKEAAKFWAAQSIKAGTKSPSQIASERADRARRAAERQRDRDARRERDAQRAKSDSSSR